jgi:two-component system OmpR family response regulator
MLRRQMGVKELASEARLFKQGQVTLNLNTYEVFWQSHALTLTLTEFNLLHTFLLTPQKVFTRDELAQAEIFRDIVSDRTIDSHIRRLRQKFATAGCENLIETVHGFGYKLGSCE